MNAASRPRSPAPFRRAWRWSPARRRNPRAARRRLWFPRRSTRASQGRRRCDPTHPSTLECPLVRVPSAMDSFSRRSASMSSKKAMWAGCTLSATATSGRTRRARSAISPGWFVPISYTAWAASGGVRASDSGTPRWLLRLPGVAKAPSAWAEERLGGGLAAAARHRGDPPRHAAARRPAELPQRIQGIVHDDARVRVARVGDFAMDQCARRPRRERRLQIIVTIPVRAPCTRELRPRITAQRDEQVARNQLAGVDVDALDDRPIDRSGAERHAQVSPEPENVVAHPPSVSVERRVSRALASGPSHLCHTPGIAGTI